MTNISMSRRAYGAAVGTMAVAGGWAVISLASGPTAVAVATPPVPLPAALATAPRVDVSTLPKSLMATVKSQSDLAPETIAGTPSLAVRVSRKGGDLLIVPGKGGLCFGGPIGTVGAEACIGLSATQPAISSDRVDGRYRYTVFSTAAVTDLAVKTTDGTTVRSDLAGGITTLWSDGAPVDYSWAVAGKPERQTLASPESAEKN